ncbi:hypothetical protein CDAR_396741 [Caerostris darwini]|uniref:Uncharacterized protein n=1 Tax=Caerostris darwini TaxID=1538125 RepID=A0AAV4PM55_9ARAC|nr:hypothetical protein CDAR_396741 [Caerostris darwini]
MDFVGISHIFRGISVIAIRYWGEVSDSIALLYAAVVSPVFVLIHDNTCTHRAVFVDAYLEGEKFARMEFQECSLLLKSIEIFRMTSTRQCINVFYTHPLIQSFKMLYRFLSLMPTLFHTTVVDHLME